MNKFLLATILATAVVSPSLAQSFDPDLGTGNIVPPVYAQKAPASVQDAYAMTSPYALAGARRSAVATDPDSFIRLQLRHAAEHGN